MSIQYYSTAQLKQLALDSAAAIGPQVPYTMEDVDKAYTYAASRCGYENPLSTDEAYPQKQRWLIEMMSLYFLRDIQEKHLLKFDIEGLKLGQVSRNVRDAIADREAAFEKARVAPETAAIFVNAPEFFGEVVIDSGIADDAIGRSTSQDNLK